MRRIVTGILLLIATLTAFASRPMVVYYESWSADPTAQDLIQLPSYVTHVIISFAKPDAQYAGNLDLSGSGLNLPYAGSELKAAVAAAKQRNPTLKVLLAVGGATYHEWQSLNTPALVKLVNDFGLDGIDIDYEQTPPNANLVIEKTQTLRAALPEQHSLTMAVMHVAAYGKDQWQNSQPSDSAWTGFLHDIQPALASINMINVMSYDAGVTYNVHDAYQAFQYYYHDVIAMGMEVPPEAWGDHRWTVATVESLAESIVQDSQNDGMMLWSMQKNNDQVSDTNPAWPSAFLLAKTACNALMLADVDTCAAPLRPIKMSTLHLRNDAWNAKQVYFVVDASPYGYPRTKTLSSGKEDVLTGQHIPVAKQLPIYVNALGYETPCIDSASKKPLSIQWTPNNVAWKVNFWLDNNNTHLCSAANAG